MKSKKAITLISLIITIVLMIIIAGTTVGISLNRFKTNNLKKMYNDIKLLNDKVENYYIKFGGLPVLRDNNNIINYNYSELNFEKNTSDNQNYYIIDLNSMENIKLNYGKEGYEHPNESDDVYIINEKTHIIYYVKGVEDSTGTRYHSLDLEGIENNNSIGPTKPEIKILSKNDEKIEIEIVPGKDNTSGVQKTEYNIKSTDIENNITQTEDIEISESTVVGNLSVNKAHEINAITTSNSGETSENTLKVNEWIEKLDIGDYINYDCYTGAKSDDLYYKSLATMNGDSDQEFQVTESDKNMKWKVLGIDKGKILITSYIPIQTTTNNSYMLRGQEGYTNGQDELDNISKIYGHGKEAINARSIIIEDINKITGRYLNETFPKYTYTKNAEDNKIYRNDATSSSYKKFLYYENDNPRSGWKELESGKTSIEIEHNYYNYTIRNFPTLLSWNDDRTVAFYYWIASCSIYCYNDYVRFILRSVKENNISSYVLFNSVGTESGYSADVRPVVTLSSDIEIGEKVDDVWQIK